MRLAGIDIGGTSVKYGVFNEKGDCLLTKESETGSNGAQLLQQIIDEVEKCLPIDAIGVSSAGLIDSKNGVIVNGVNLADTDGLQVKKTLEDKFNVPVSLDNDVNAAALGENAFGVGKEYSEFLFLTYGTGIGGAIVQQSSLLNGQGGFAAEFGHMITHGNGLPCNCGGNGCYEKYAATSALVKAAKELDSKYADGRIIFQAFNDGNKEIRALINDWIDEIVIGLTNLVHVFNPATIIIGGGIMEQEVLIQMIKEKLDESMIPSFKEVEILKATLGNQSGMLGAISNHIK